MMAFFIGQLAGLAAKILMGSSFNAAVELDAFTQANIPSETLVTIMAGGLLVSSFIPVFVKFLVAKDQDAAWKLASSVVNLIFIIMGSLAVLEILFAGPIVKYLLAPAFGADKQVLTIHLLRIQAISMIFFGLSGVSVGILNSHQKFLFSALAPTMYNLGIIFGILVLSPSMGVYGLAWGVVIGSACHFLIQLPSILKLKGKYLPTLGLRFAPVGEVFRLMLPRMFGAATVWLMRWINGFLASFMVPGSVYSLGLGFTLMMMAQIAIGQAAATAAMPTFSAQFARGENDALRRTLASTLRSVILLSIPASAGLILLRVPIVEFLFQHGEFTPQTTQLVAWALAWYSVGLVFHSTLEVLVRAYYAMHDTRTPVLVGAAAMALAIGLSLVFSRLFTSLGWQPHGGLALAVSVSTSLEVITLLILMRRRLQGLHGREIALSVGLSALGTAGMVLALVGWLRAFAAYPAMIKTAGGILLGGLMYGLLLLVLRVPETRAVIQMVRRRLVRKPALPPQ